MFALISKLLPNTVTNTLVGTFYRISLLGAETHSLARDIKMPGMKVKILPALGDNYMYLVVDSVSKEAAIVDPVDHKSVLKAVEEEEVTLTKVLTTHHHWDHAGGNKELVSKIKIPVYGGDDRVEAVTNIVGHGDQLNIGGLTVQCLATPCHTSGHICYYVKPNGDDTGAVFTGDTLFIAGCGRFFEGTPEQMYAALVEKLGSLPDSTQVYCGHEYTTANLKFAKTIEPNNELVEQKLKWAEETRTRNVPTVPSTIGDEKEFNPFMRVNVESVQKKCGTNGPVATMKWIRAAKDKFKA